MSEPLFYTVRTGDTVRAIVRNVNACAGVFVSDIEAANPSLPATELQIGESLQIPPAHRSDQGPSPAGGLSEGLTYTIRSGDTYARLAALLANCAGVSQMDLERANAGLDLRTLKPGQVLRIAMQGPPKKQNTRDIPAVEHVGYWRRTWKRQCTPPASATMGLLFSGWNSLANAGPDSARVASSVDGTRFITLGGGNSKGKFTQSVLEALDDEIRTGALGAYAGLAYDVEVGDPGLSHAFVRSFALAREHGLKVMVTVSNSAPYGIADGGLLMDAFFACEDIDFLSPQLYQTGAEAENLWGTSHGISWADYASSRALIVPSIVRASLYANARATLASHGVTTQGYVVWNC